MSDPLDFVTLDTVPLVNMTYPSIFEGPQILRVYVSSTRTITFRQERGDTWERYDSDWSSAKSATRR